MDYRRGCGGWSKRRNMGDRRAPTAGSRRKSAGISVPVRLGNRCSHLFRCFPLMLLLVIFCPIVAAIVIMARAQDGAGRIGVNTRDHIASPRFLSRIAA